MHCKQRAGSRREGPGFLHQDVSLEEPQPGVIEVTERRFGRLDVMVVNAGIGSCARLSTSRWPTSGGKTAVNLDGVFLSVKYAVAAMRRTGCGSIIMPSVAGIRGSAGLAGYCATKGGVRLFAKVAMECAAADDGNRVNTVYPGLSTRRSGTKLPAPTGSNAPIDSSEVAKTGVPFGRAGRRRILPMGCASSPPTCPAT